MNADNSVAVEPSMRRAGCLLEPFRWAAIDLMGMTVTEPRLAAHLLELDKLRLHVIAFYLAHRLRGWSVTDEPAFLSTARSRDILAKATGRPPGRLLGLLRRLPYQVMEPTVYTLLSTLSSNDILVTTLLRQPSFDSRAIAALATIPPSVINPPLLRVIHGDLNLLIAIGETVVWFRERRNLDVARQFSTVPSLADLRHLTAELLRGLPPAAALPPRKVGPATLIETTPELKRAALRGKNCLLRFEEQMADFRTFFYLWEDGNEPIFVQIRRCDLLGWYLSDMKLAKNKAPSSHTQQIIARTFESFGIELHNVSKNLRTLLYSPFDRDH